MSAAQGAGRGAVGSPPPRTYDGTADTREQEGENMKKEIIFIDEETLTPEEREALADEPAGE